MAELNYVTQFWPRIIEMYGHLLMSNELYNTNQDIQIINTKDIRLPKITVSGYKDPIVRRYRLTQVLMVTTLKQRHWTMTAISNSRLTQWMLTKQIRLFPWQTFNRVLRRRRLFPNWIATRSLSCIQRRNVVMQILKQMF